MTRNASLIAAAFGIAVLSVSANAAQMKQINAIERGTSQADVIKTLGQPLNSPSWLNGTHSLVYKVPGALEPSRVAYINFGRDNKVINVQFGDDGRSN
jgi:outer membrane protein assembly factor BamE (lipoprotein component of BamABCDE complex)